LQIEDLVDVEIRLLKIGRRYISIFLKYGNSYWKPVSATLVIPVVNSEFIIAILVVGLIYYIYFISACMQ
jgi:hypothetical protein